MSQPRANDPVAGLEAKPVQFPLLGLIVATLGIGTGLGLLARMFQVFGQNQTAGYTTAAITSLPGIQAGPPKRQ